MIAREWLDRGARQINSIDAFTDYWRAFNNLFSTVSNARERKKIRLFISQHISEAQATEALQSNATCVSYLLSQPVKDMRGNGNDTMQNIQAFDMADASLAKLTEVFMVIYQVRCNLEHGQKTPSVDRDIALCKSAAPLVAYVVSQNI